MRRCAFTMIELVFVIVVMGIIGKFGTEFLAQAYRSFIFSSVNHTLQANSDMAVEFIGARLQERIRDSAIARTTLAGTPVALASAVNGSGYTVLEWIAADTDGFRGNNSDTPNWSGVIDLGLSSATILNSPETNTSAIDDLVSALSYGNSGIANVGLYFIGANSDIGTSYGWNGALADQNGAIHPVKAVVGSLDRFQSSIAGVDFTNVDIYEYYKLVWTANAIAIENYDTTTKMGDLVFYYNYQPWNGLTTSSPNRKRSVIMENVSTFKFKAVGSIIKIQVCAKSNVIEEYSICKEKTIF